MRNFTGGLLTIQQVKALGTVYKVNMQSTEMLAFLRLARQNCLLDSGS